VLGFRSTLPSALFPKLKNLLRRFLASFYFSELSQQLFLTVIKIDRSFDLNVDMQITTTIASKVGYALSSQSDALSTLGAGGDVDASGAIHGLDL
jgi:hypothetical protein